MPQKLRMFFYKNFTTLDISPRKQLRFGYRRTRTQGVVSLSIPKQPDPPKDGLRPVNLRTDLAPLADLIELAFADTMDNSGRAAVREMRYLSRMGPGLNVLAGVSDLTQGIGLGYVWIEDGRLIGNVSIYPANWPAAAGDAWIIANVAVHPDFRGRGIAHKLMLASLETIRRRSKRRDHPIAILQVENSNSVAQHLYERLGFTRERVWTHWRRSANARLPAPIDHAVGYITRRRRGEWHAEYALAQCARPAKTGGIGWLRPTDPSFFRKPILVALNDLINLRSIERLVIRSRDEQSLLAVMWIESAFAAATVQLTIMTDPAVQGLYDEALINLATRRYTNRSALAIEHPADDTFTSALLQRYNFTPQRTLLHMRWEG